MILLEFYRNSEVINPSLKIEISLSVVIADIFNHLSYALLLISLERYQSVLYVLAYKVTECAAEILMPWIREE